jgi:hypothetical protein
MPSEQLTNANAVANPCGPLKFLRWLAGSVFVVAAVLSCLIFAIQSRNRRRAENLLRDVQTIHVGKSTTEDVTNLLRNYRDTGYPASSSMCPSADSSYSVRIANDSLNQLGMKFPKLRKIGLKPWGVVAMFLLEHGKVCYFEYSFGLMRSEQWKELIVEVAAPPRVPGEEFEPYFPQYLGGKAIRFTTLVYPEATLDQRRRAFDLDLSCLTQVGGCTNACEMMPAAWPDYLKEAREEGANLPADELADSRCQEQQGSR